MVDEVVTLANAKEGQEVTMSSGKVVISDGRGGGRRKRNVKKPAAAAGAPKVRSNSSIPATSSTTNRSLAAQPAKPLVAQPVQGQTQGRTPNAPNTIVRPTQQAPQSQGANPNTVQTGLRKLGNRGNTLSDLVKQTKGR